MNEPIVAPTTGPLRGLRVFDLTRVLAGPTCAQMLADLGADVIKIERPGAGDDTRGFAPPYMPGTQESAYFVGVNRNKRSVTLDIAKPEGQAIALQLIAQCDILVENFKVGALAKYGLGYAELHEKFPRLIYCSITGFGQTGPYAPRPGYDSLIQAMGGVMSLTGEPDGLPQKVGVPVADLFAGLYGCIGILAALRHRDATGQGTDTGQQIDIGMLDTHVAWLANQGMNYLATGENPARLGNQHPNIVPYQVFPTADGHIVLSIGNDPTFKRFCEAFALTHLLEDARFATNAGRVENRQLVTDTLTPVMQLHPTTWWVDRLESLNIGCGPINKLSEVFADPHIVARNAVVEMAHGSGETVKMIANPVRLSQTPPDYRLPPPLLGEHTDAVLRERLGLDAAALTDLRTKGDLMADHALSVTCEQLPCETIYLPFESGPYRMAMGLTTVPDSAWFEIDQRYVQEMSERHRLLADQHHDVFGALQVSDAARMEVLQQVVDNLTTYAPAWFIRDSGTLHNALTGETWDLVTPPCDPLELAGRLVQEDLCIIQGGENGPIFTASVLCFPSRWRLHEKLGHPLTEVHGPVPFYAERLATPVDRFMAKVRPGHIASRLNWSVLDDPAMYQPTGKWREATNTAIDADNAGDALHLRVERQTLRRLPQTDAILFAIRVHSYPLTAAITTPIAASRLAEAVRALPEQTQCYKSLKAFGPALLAWLDARSH